jgi:hypothetical protein
LDSHAMPCYALFSILEDPLVESHVEPKLVSPLPLPYPA